MLTPLAHTRAEASACLHAGRLPVRCGMNGEAQDVTTKDSGGWTELFGQSSLNSVEVSGSGFASTGTQFLDLMLIAESTDRRVGLGFEMADGRSWTGQYVLTSFNITSEATGAVAFDFAASSSGAILGATGEIE